jgi:hypothetical protein
MMIFDISVANPITNVDVAESISILIGGKRNRLI